MKYFCGICSKLIRLNSNAIYCDICKQWIHPRCNLLDASEFSKLADADASEA